MNPMRGYYSLIQYCPDLGRFEAANVGVLLFCPEIGFLRAVTSNNNQRIKRFFGAAGHDWDRIQSFKQGLCDRLELESKQIINLEDLKEFIALRANLLQITDPLPMRIADPEKDLELLFKELIGDTIKKPASKSLKKTIGEKFVKAGLEKKILTDIQIEVPVWQKQVEIPFGFQNGRFNLMTPAKFEAENIEKVTETACKYAVEGRSLYENEDKKFGKMQLIVIGKFAHGKNDAANRVKRILGENSVKLVKTDELPTLISEIQKSGKELSSRLRSR